MTCYLTDKIVVLYRSYIWRKPWFVKRRFKVMMALKLLFLQVSHVQGAGQKSKAGIGIFMHWKGEEHHAVFLEATTFAGSSLEAEAQAMVLAAAIGSSMGVHEPNFMTDCQTLAEAAAKGDPLNCPGHWSIRPNLNQFLSYTRGSDARVFKITKENNVVAHRQAKDAFNFHYACSCIYSCSGSRHSSYQCLVKVVISSLNVHPCTLLSVTCL